MADQYQLHRTSRRIKAVSKRRRTSNSSASRARQRRPATVSGVAALRSSRTAAVAAAVAQVASGAVAHVAASDCLPSGASLALALPAALLGVLLLGALLDRRPLLLLTGGQLAVHAALAVSACTGDGEASPVLLTFAHVAALVLCRAALGRVVVSAERAASCLVQLLRPRAAVPGLRLAAPYRPSARAGRSSLHRADLLAAAPRRGPPRWTCLPA